MILLFGCALGICISYLTYGFIQEECLGREKTVTLGGSVTSFILMTQALTNVLVAKLLMISIPSQIMNETSEGVLNHRLLFLSTF